MAAPTIYRSSDTGAPILTGNSASLVALLDAVLVNGYGSTRATGTITSSGVAPSNNDTVTIGLVTYTFKTALTPAANEILIGTAAVSLSNLAAAIGNWGVAGTNYGSGSTQQTLVQVTGLTSTVLTLTAFAGGTGGNAVALARSAVTLTVSGANLAGGTGSDTTASLGWGKEFSGTSKRSYRAAAGVRHYLDVDDSAPDSTALGRNARIRGYETMTGVGTGTNLFPSSAQQTTCVYLKSTTLAVTARPWIIIGDDRTFYFFSAAAGTDPPNLGTITWTDAFFFGEIYSALSSDNYRTILSYPSGTTANVTAAYLGTIAASAATTAAVNYAMPRSYLGTGTSEWVTPITNNFFQTSQLYSSNSSIAFPNSPDGGIYLNAVNVGSKGTGSAGAAVSYIRGHLRGFYLPAHYITAMNDQDTFSGVGDFTGQTFMVLHVAGTRGQGVALQTTAWASSP